MNTANSKSVSSMRTYTSQTNYMNCYICNSANYRQVTGKPSLGSVFPDD